MQKDKQIQLAIAALEIYPEADVLFITTDEKVFDTPEKAVSNAVQLSAGNPVVFEVPTKDLKTVAPVVPLVKLTKVQTIEKATKQLTDMQAIVAEKQAAFDNAEPKKKGAAKNAVTKALANEAAAKVALDLANEMPEDEKVENENKQD